MRPLTRAEGLSKALSCFSARILSEACEFLKECGTVRKTDFFNVLVLRVNDVQEMLEAFAFTRIEAGLIRLKRRLK